MSLPSTNRQWLLRRRPQGLVTAADLSLHRAPVPAIGDGQVLVRVMFLCMDPTIRNFMNPDPGYGAPIALRDGCLRYDIDIRHGFERIPETFNCLFTGAHAGRLVVDIEQ